jgi:hypothetical protein
LLPNDELGPDLLVANRVPSGRACKPLKSNVIFMTPGALLQALRRFLADRADFAGLFTAR